MKYRLAFFTLFFCWFTVAFSQTTRHEKLPPRSTDYQAAFQEGIASYVVKYADDLFRGGRVSSKTGMQFIKDKGVMIFLSINPTSVEKKLAHDFGILLVELELTEQNFNRKAVMDFLALLKKYKSTVYLNDADGKHIAGVLAAAYRIYGEGWEFDKAIIEFGKLGGSLKDDFQMLETLVRKANLKKEN